MFTFKGCTALITGASSGLGAEFARQLAPHADTLILVARRMDRLETLKAEIARPGLEVHCLAADLADPMAITGMLDQLATTGLQVTFLINNAGLGDHGLFEESDQKRVSSMLEVNITALTSLTHALVPSMIAAGHGAILNVSSIVSRMPFPKMAVYAATKAYVTSFSEALRAELRGTGVSVTVLCPGPVNTEFYSVAERASSDGSLESPGFFKVSAQQVAREGLEAVVRDRARVIPGMLVWLVMTLATLVPAFILRRIMQPRRPS